MAVDGMGNDMSGEEYPSQGLSDPLLDILFSCQDWADPLHGAEAAARKIRAKWRLVPIEDAKASGGELFPFNSVWLYPSNTITEVNIGIQTVKLAEPFKVPKTGWYRFNAQTKTMEEA